MMTRKMKNIYTYIDKEKVLKLKTSFVQVGNPEHDNKMSEMIKSYFVAF